MRPQLRTVDLMAMDDSSTSRALVHGQRDLLGRRDYAEQWDVRTELMRKNN